MSPDEVAARPGPLSVVIPTRDTRTLTLSCLRSLERHAVTGMEVVVVDDASTDGTREAVREEFPSVRVLENGVVRGFTASANRGLSEARGEIVLLLNSDTEVRKDALGALLAAFEVPRLGVAGALLSYPDGRDQWSGGSEPGLLWMFIQASGTGRVLGTLFRRRRPWSGTRGRGPEDRRPVDWVTGAALAVAGRTLDEVGVLDERFSFYAQDLDFCLRVRDAGWEVCIVPGFRVVHHHGSSITRARKTVGAQQLELLWQDLLRWAEKRHGVAWRRRARLALAWGGRFRVLGRMLATPFLVPVRGNAWIRETGACRRALRALRSRPER